MAINLVVIVFVSVVTVITGARILGIMSYPSYSHQIVFQPLWEELSLRGHNVTTLTTDPIRKSNLINLTEIDLSSSYENWKKIMAYVVNQSQESYLMGFVEIIAGSINFMDKQLGNKQVQDLIHNNKVEFDLVIVEYLTPAMFAFAERFNCPHIGIVSFDPPSFIYDFVGNSLHPAFDVDSLRPFYEKDTTLGRLKSVLYWVVVKMVNYFYFMPANEALIKRHFGSGYSSLWSIAQNASALLINSNTVFQKIIPLFPNVIQIGGRLQARDSSSLTEVMEKAINRYRGFIYFSMGTNVKILHLSPQLLNVFLEVFSQLPYLVLFKTDSNHIPNLPKNILTSQWFPQQAVLRHPKIKLFITQGGMQSLTEAIMFKVPMIGIPIIADQPYNVQKMVAQGYGLELDYKKLQTGELKKAILEVIENPKYRNNIKRLSELADDQPTTGLERAVWWVEYVLRNEGAKHLRNPFLDVPLYQYLLLDVIVVGLLILLITIYILYILGLSVMVVCKRFKLKLKNE